MRSITKYLSSSFEELKKVVWPTRNQAIWLTVIVIATALLIGTYLTLFGYMYQSILQKLLFKS